MDSTRQRKIARLIQRDLSELFQRDLRDLTSGKMVSVTVVRLTPDLSTARVFLSIFPSQDSEKLIVEIRKSTKKIRYLLAQRVRHQLRKTPDLEFQLDDSLDYAQHIDDLLG